MKRMFLSMFVVFFSPIMPMGMNDARNADNPVITTLIEQRDGSRIQLSFRAIHWNKELMASVKTDKALRDYYNTYLANKMGVLTTNVKIKFGPLLQLDPGEYFLGFRVNEPVAADQEPYWSMILSTDKETRITIPLYMIQEQTIQEYLSFVFTPGITDRDFQFNMMYGDRSVSVRWTMIGIPATTQDTPAASNPAWDLPLIGSPGIPSPDTIRAATASLIDSATEKETKKENGSSSSKKKAGSGSLRYLNEKKK